MRSFSRRSFLHWLSSGVILPILQATRSMSPIRHGLILGVRAKTGGRGNIADDFQREELWYRMRVLWIKQAAVGKVLFERATGGHGYRATLEGRTTGVVGWLTRYRRDVYTSFMEVIDGGRRLRPLRFEEDIVIGKRIRRKVTFFDYGKRMLVKRRMNRRGVFIRTEEKIPEGVVYDDFLTAFYNFRQGVYGRIERGKRYRVRTLPKAGMSTIDVEIATQEEEMRMRRGQGNDGCREYYVTVLLDKEITRSRTGRVKGWVSEDLVPLEGTIEDVAFVGDVHGVLVGKRRPS